jgi:hypothetical protein
MKEDQLTGDQHQKRFIKVDACSLGEVLCRIFAVRSSARQSNII